MRLIDEAITNCPNCASVLTEKNGYLNCKYCGTTIYDFATLDVEKPFYMRVKTRDDVTLTKVRCVSATIEMRPYSDSGYIFESDSRISRFMNSFNTHQTLTMQFDVLPADMRGERE